MSRGLVAVLDASALLAYLQGEPGAKRVAEVLEIGAAIGAVNWAETLTKLAEHGQDPDVVATLLSDRGLLNKTLLVYPVDENIARKIAQLRMQTRSLGLSLGDRACLALASQLTLPALTTDRAWSNLNLAVQIRLIRASYAIFVPDRPSRQETRNRVRAKILGLPTRFLKETRFLRTARSPARNLPGGDRKKPSQLILFQLLHLLKAESCSLTNRFFI